MPVRPPPARLLALLLALVTVAALSASSASAAVSPPSATAISVVVTGPDQIGLMPGDELPVTTLELRAQGALRYTLSARTSGSAALAGMVMVAIRTASGDVLYEGPLADARLGDGADGSSAGRILRDTTEVLSVSGFLSTSAGDGVQGAGLSVSWIVQANELAGS